MKALVGMWESTALAGRVCCGQSTCCQTAQCTAYCIPNKFESHLVRHDLGACFGCGVASPVAAVCEGTTQEVLGFTPGLGHCEG